MTSHGLPHHGVLAHKEGSLATKRGTDLLHLSRPNIVGSDYEALAAHKKIVNTHIQVAPVITRNIRINYVNLLI